ncbi:MAG TPA: hypothetical protein VFH89_15985 [Sphingomicrobium sp.]|nr:hypothetical protein [Sphingomicrobium sp.]
MDIRAIRVSAVVVAAGYSTLALVLLGSVGAIGLFPWVISPVMIAAVVVFVASKKPTQRSALAVLAALAGVGAGPLTWGIAWDPGDYNHLVALFLPIYQLAFLVLAMAAFGLATLIRRNAS